MKINKAAAGDSATMVFQDNFQGRAEIGLAGDDDFHFKVSPDGAVFHEGIVIDHTSGAVSFPNTVLPTGDAIATIAKAFTDGLHHTLTAAGGVEGGNAGRTPLFVMNTTDGKAQIASLEDGNECVAYLTGDDVAAGIVKERVFLRKGEIYIFEGLQNGAVITSSGGAYGYSGQLDGTAESPMPLGCLGFAFTDTFFFAFRNSDNSAGNIGLVFVANGPVQSTVAFRFGAGGAVDGQADVTLDPFGFHTLLHRRRDRVPPAGDQPDRRRRLCRHGRLCRPEW